MIAQRMRTVFVLSGGANVGAVQVGMLRALLERNVVPDALVGCSVGAINATAVGVSPTLAQVERLEAVWRALGPRDIFPSSRLHQAWHVARGRTHLHHDHALRRTIERWLDIHDLSETAVPVHVVTTELHTGAPRWWSGGPVVDVLAASCCLPGVFPPVDIDGTLHVDGGVVQNVPVGHAVQLGARRIVVLDATSWLLPSGMPRSAFGVFLQSVRAARQAHLHHDLSSIPRAVEVIWLSLDEPPHLAYDDFSRTDELVEAGYRVATDRLAGRESVPRRGPLRRHRRSAQVPTLPGADVAS